MYVRTCVYFYQSMWIACVRDPYPRFEISLLLFRAKQTTNNPAGPTACSRTVL